MARMKAARTAVEGLSKNDVENRSGFSSPCVRSHVQGHPEMWISAAACDAECSNTSGSG